MSIRLLEAVILRGIIERLEEAGIPSDTIKKIKADNWSPEFLDSLDNWSRQFLMRGHIWGNDASQCGKYIINNLPAGRRILEIGSGYGRDTKKLIDHGHLVTAFDNSEIAVLETIEQMKSSKKYNDNSSVTFGNIISTQIPQLNFDAAIAHRVLHLPDAEDLPIILNRVSASLNYKGKIVFTFRKPEDFNPEKMTRIDDHTAEYSDPSRKGHRINFYDQERLDPILSTHFTELVYMDTEEPESCDKEDEIEMTKLVRVVGRKKTKQEREEYDHS